MSEIEKLKQRLADMGCERLSSFPGERLASSEEVAAQVNRALAAIERGDCEEVQV